MANKWTDEQLEAITQRGCNLLVAAAAGAGKTAVLVERIIRKITDIEKPVDIDRLLVVTFTNAAATEMRERIGNALAAALEKDPASGNLQRQMALLDRSSIMTIHSFCLEVVRGHFHSLGLDPAFRIADETESTLMKLEVLDKLFEDKYENEPEDSAFFRLVESYGGGRDDSSFRDIVLNLHRFTRSSPWPEQWLAAQAEAYSPCASACLSSTPWARVLLSSAAAELQGLLALLKKAAARASRAQGLEPYCGVLADDIQQLEGLLEICSRALNSCGETDGSLVDINNADGRDISTYIESINSENKVDGEDGTDVTFRASGIDSINALNSADSTGGNPSIERCAVIDAKDTAKAYIADCVYGSDNIANNTDNTGNTGITNNTNNTNNTNIKNSESGAIRIDNISNTSHVAGCDVNDADNAANVVSATDGNNDAFSTDTHHSNSVIDWNTIHAAFAAYQPARLPRCQKDADPEAQEEVKEARGLVKEKVKKLCECGFNETAEEIKADFRTIYPMFSYLAALVNEFDESFSLKKKDKGLVDFNDLEHYCLKILLKDGEPTEAAKELRQKYEEILIDEYQDSNLIQELILGTVSGNQDGIHNVFMVGDVKQSIYRFRQAKPELFLSKYASYPREKGLDSRAITLYKNFRSRAQVIDGVNFIFRQIMSETVGELDYNEKEALNPGAVFEDPELPCQTGGPVELNIIDITSEKEEILPEKYGIIDECGEEGCHSLSGEDNSKDASRQDISNAKTDMQLTCKQCISKSKDGAETYKQNIDEPKADKQEISKVKDKPENYKQGLNKSKTDNPGLDAGSSDEPEEEAIDSIQTEARIVGKRILNLTSHTADGLMVYDKMSGGYRHAQYKDIVILMRATKGWADVFTDELAAMGIPAYADVGLGYFRTVEVDTMLSLLQIIDNPMQDIPMLAVLRSPICGFSADELAEIRLADRNVSIYEAMKLLIGANGQEGYRGSYEGSHGGNYGGNYRGSYEGSHGGNYGGNYRGSYEGSHGGNYGGNCEGSHEGNYGGNYEGSHGGNYGGNCEGSHEGNYGGNYEGSHEGNYEGNYEGSYEGNCEGSYEGNCEGNCGGNYEGNCGGNYEGNEQMQSGNDTDDCNYDDKVYYVKNQKKSEIGSNCSNNEGAPSMAQKKTADFLRKLWQWRNIAGFLPTDELVWQLMNETGYYSYVGVLPGGPERQANLRMLFERARQYEETSYKGLFNFINFINKLKSSGGDMGSAKILGENDNVVRIMSIHKSKGLEFPVVFVAGCGKRFNLRDLNEGILLHQDLGFGPDVVDLEKRTITSTLPKHAISRKLRLETLSEEMRILYVAFTRAKEKLILTGCVSNIEKACAKWCTTADTAEEKLPSYDMQQAATYLDWLGPAAARHESALPIRMAAAPWGNISTIKDEDSQWKVKMWGKGAASFEKEAAEANENIRQWLAAVNGQDEYGQNYIIDHSREDEYCRNELIRCLEWQYPAKMLTAVPAKLSVTELKRRFSVENEDEAAAPFIRRLAERPAFMEQEKGISAAGKGTIMHFVMQHLDLERLRAIKEAQECGMKDEESLSAEIRSQIKKMVENEQLTELEAGTVRISGIARFFSTNLGIRMLMAETVNRETAFNIQIKCSEIYKELSDGPFNDEVMLLQGVVDCWFRSDDGLVLLDYKTDYVPEGGTDSIRERYTIQLDYYTRALEKITGESVKERYLYLFYTGEIISC